MLQFAVYSIFAGVSLTCVCKRRFEECLPVALMLTSLVLYITGLLGNLLIGVVLLVAFAVLIPACGFFHEKAQANQTVFWARVFTPGFAVYCILCVILYVMDMNKGFSIYDEFSHWGPMVKEMVRLDQFYSVEASLSLTHKDYPPAIQLIEYFACRISGGMAEDTTYYSLHLLSFSLMLSAVRKKQEDRINHTVQRVVLTAGAFLLGLLVFPIGEASFYNSIYVDCMMGLLLGYALFCVWTVQTLDKFQLLRFLVLFSFMVIVKQIEIVFVLLAMFALVLNLGWQCYKKKLSSEQNVLCGIWGLRYHLFAIFVIPITFFCSWSIYTKKMHLGGQFSISSIRPWDLPGIMNGTKGELWQQQAAFNFLDALKDRPIVFSFTLWIPAGILLFTVYVIVAYVQSKIAKKGNGDVPPTWMVIGILLLGAFGYTYTMLLTYIFGFNSYEGVRIVCYERYMGTYWLGVVMVIIMFFVSYIVWNPRFFISRVYWIVGTTVSFFLVGILGFMNFERVQNFLPHFSYYSATTTSEMIAEQKFLQEHTVQGDIIYASFNPQSEGIVGMSFFYHCLPRKIMFNFSITEMLERKSGIETVANNVTEMKAFLEQWQCDYFYLQTVDEVILSRFGQAFSRIPESGDLYKISYDQNQMMFELIAQYQPST